MKTEMFELKPEHLKLLRAAHWYWDDGEFGAPAISCKRPYGNSYVYGDMHEILGRKGSSEDHHDEYDLLHSELIPALEVIIDNFGGFCPYGKYSREVGGTWKLHSYFSMPIVTYQDDHE